MTWQLCKNLQQYDSQLSNCNNIGFVPNVIRKQKLGNILAAETQSITSDGDMMCMETAGANIISWCPVMYMM